MIRDENFNVIFVIRWVDYLVRGVESVWYREKKFRLFPKKKNFAFFPRKNPTESSPEEPSTEEKIDAEQKEINKASATLRKMKMRLLGRKAEEDLSEFGKPAFHKPTVKKIEIENIPSDDESIANSEFSIATNVVVEKGLNRLVNE